PAKMPGTVHHVAGQCGREDAGKIPEEVLKTRPAPGSLRSRKSLGNGPDVGSTHAKKNDSERDGGNAKGFSADSAQAQEEPPEGNPAAGEGLARQARARAGGDPPVGEPTRQNGGERAEEISRAPDARHFFQRETPFAHQIVGQPGQQEIA